MSERCRWFIVFCLALISKCSEMFPHVQSSKMCKINQELYRYDKNDWLVKSFRDSMRWQPGKRLIPRRVVFQDNMRNQRGNHDCFDYKFLRQYKARADDNVFSTGFRDSMRYQRGILFVKDGFKDSQRGKG